MVLPRGTVPTLVVAVLLTAGVAGCMRTNSPDFSADSPVASSAVSHGASSPTPPSNDRPSSSGASATGTDGEIGQEDTGRASGSPLNLPLRVNFQGFNFDVVRNVIVDYLEPQCGASTPCYRIVEATDNGGEFRTCQFVSSDPPLADTPQPIPYGSVITLYRGAIAPTDAEDETARCSAGTDGAGEVSTDETTRQESTEESATDLNNPQVSTPEQPGPSEASATPTGPAGPS